MKLKISKEAKIGFVTIIAILLLIWGFNFLKGKNIFKPSNVFYLVYSDLGGLKESNAVLVNGFQIGMVTDLTLDRKTQGKVYVRILVDNDINIPKGTVAQLSTVDIMGTKAIEMIMSTSVEYHQSGDTINTKIESSLMDVMEEKVTGITENVDSLLIKLNDLFNEEFKKQIQSSVNNIEETSKSVTDLLDEDEVANMLAKLDKILSDLSVTSDKLPKTIETMNSIADSIQQANIKTFILNTSATIEGLNKILGKINAGEGTTGKLVNNDSLYVNLTAVTKELELLLNDMRIHPKKYVHFSLFGKKSGK